MVRSRWRFNRSECAVVESAGEHGYCGLLVAVGADEVEDGR